MDQRELHDIMVNQAPDGVIFADREGIIRSWNDAATAIFGYTHGEAMGQNLDIIIPEQFREAHWTGYDRALEAGVTKYIGQSLATRARKASGEDIYVELSFAIMKDATGAVIGALAHARDIDERFKSDRQMRRDLRELRAKMKELEPQI